MLVKSILPMSSRLSRRESFSEESDVSNAFKRTIGATIMASLFLSACASVPHGPALSLANAGVATTSTFSTNVRITASQVQYVDVTEAFVATYDYCANSALPCSPQLQSGAMVKLRQDLANVILLRAKAIDALGKAYGALKTEAEYDARGDLVSATNSAIEGVNNFAAAALAIGGAAPAAALIGEPLKQIAGFGVGLLADRNQRRRLLAGSEAIAAATKRLRDALAVEAFVYDSLADYIEKSRTAAKIRMLDAGLVSNTDALMPMAANLGLKPVAGVDAVIAKSPQTKIAVTAMLQAQSRADVQLDKDKYQASIAALDALLRAHDELKKNQSVSLADVDRFLGELNASLDTGKKE